MQLNDKIEIEFEKSTGNLAEIYQKHRIMFAYLNKLGASKYKQIHEFVLCKDFLGDAIYANKYKEIIHVYGFRFDGTKDKLDSDKTRLIIKLTKAADADNFEDNIQILNNIEKQLKFSSKTKYYFIQNKKYILILGPKEWQSKVFLISMYSLLLKMLTYKIIDKENWVEEFIGNYRLSDETERIQAVNLSIFIQKTPMILKKYPSLVCGYEQHEDQVGIYQVHNSTGIVSVFNSYLKKDNVFSMEFTLND
jgi:hypothetical protein